MEDINLKIMRENKEFGRDYLQALSLLYKHKVFEFLRTLSRPKVIRGGENVQVQAANGLISAGYNECLDDITTFIDKFIQAEIEQSTIAPDYGGLQALVDAGDLSKEEADGLRNSSRSSSSSNSSAAFK